MFKYLYNNFWYPFFGKILDKFVFLIEGKNKQNKKPTNNPKRIKN